MVSNGGLTNVRGARSLVFKIRRSAGRNVLKRPAERPRMAKRNTWDGFCGVCGSRVRALEGVIEAAGPGEGYRILCRSMRLPVSSTRQSRLTLPGFPPSTLGRTATSAEPGFSAGGIYPCLPSSSWWTLESRAAKRSPSQVRVRIRCAGRARSSGTSERERCAFGRCWSSSNSGGSRSRGWLRLLAAECGSEGGSGPDFAPGEQGRHGGPLPAQCPPNSDEVKSEHTRGQRERLLATIPEQLPSCCARGGSERV